MSLVITIKRSDLLKKKGNIDINISAEEVLSPLAVAGQLNDLLISVMSEQGGSNENA